MSGLEFQSVVPAGVLSESAAGESAFVGGNGVEVVAFFVEFTLEVVVSHDVPLVALGEEYLLAYF